MAKTRQYLDIGITRGRYVPSASAPRLWRD